MGAFDVRPLDGRMYECVRVFLCSVMCCVVYAGTRNVPFLVQKSTNFRKDAFVQNEI
jgi:hypothetical protein